MNEPVASPVAEIHTPLTAWEKNRAAFHAMLDDLKLKYNNQLVAIHNGEVVAYGTETNAVRMAATNKVGEVPVYIGLVSTQRIARCWSVWKARKH